MSVVGWWRSMTSLFFLIALISGSVLSTAHAMTVSPMTIDMATIGQGGSAAISVVNPSARPLPVEVVVHRLELDLRGQSTRTPEDEDWLVFPPQAMIPPGGTQIFRIQWVGDPELEASRSYNFMVAQLPVALPEGVSGVQIVYNFAVMVNIAPPGVQPALEIAGLEVVQREDGVAVPRVVVRNPSRHHAYMSGANLELALRDGSGATAWSLALTPGELRSRIGIGLVQPGKERRFTLSDELPSAEGELTGSIAYVGRR